MTLEDVKALVNVQAEDFGLWFDARHASEAYLQQELRKLHAAVEASEMVCTKCATITEAISFVKDVQRERDAACGRAAVAEAKLKQIQELARESEARLAKVREWARGLTGAAHLRECLFAVLDAK